MNAPPDAHGHPTWRLPPSVHSSSNRTQAAVAGAAQARRKRKASGRLSWYSARTQAGRVEQRGQSTCWPRYSGPKMARRWSVVPIRERAEDHGHLCTGLRALTTSLGAAAGRRVPVPVSEVGLLIRGTEPTTEPAGGSWDCSDPPVEHRHDGINCQWRWSTWRRGMLS